MGMEQILNDAVKKDARTESSKEECALALGMGQRDYAAARNAQIKSSRGGCIRHGHGANVKYKQ